MQSFIFNLIIIAGMLLFLIASQIKEYFILNESFIFNLIIIDGMLLFLIALQIKEFFTLNAIIYFQSYNYRGYVIISYCFTNQRIFYIECNHLFSIL